MAGSEKAEAVQVQGPTVLNGQQMQPQDVNDEKMHIEREEDETIMGEGAVAVEAEATSKERTRAESGQQP